MRSIEPVGAGALLCPEVVTAFEELGLGLNDPSERNLVARTAPMGEVNAEVAVAVAYNFNPEFVATVVPGVWDRANPEVILQCQSQAYAPVLAAALAPLGQAHVAELSALARTAGSAATRALEGRPSLPEWRRAPGQTTITWRSGTPPNFFASTGATVT